MQERGTVLAIDTRTYQGLCLGYEWKWRGEIWKSRACSLPIKTCALPDQQNMIFCPHHI